MYNHTKDESVIWLGNNEVLKSLTKTFTFVDADADANANADAGTKDCTITLRDRYQAS